MSEGSIIVHSKWPFKWKGDEYGMIDRPKARLLPRGCSPIEGVDGVDTFAPTVSTTPNRFVAAMTCKLDWGLMHLDGNQAFIQPEWDTRSILELGPWV